MTQVNILKVIAMTNDIEISAYNDHEQGRLERLRQVGEEISTKKLPVQALHDHKGTLYINWREKPSTTQIFDATEIWRNNSEYLVNHFLNGRELIVDILGDNPFE